MDETTSKEDACATKKAALWRVKVKGLQDNYHCWVPYHQTHPCELSSNSQLQAQRSNSRCTSHVMFDMKPLFGLCIKLFYHNKEYSQQNMVMHCLCNLILYLLKKKLNPHLWFNMCMLLVDTLAFDCMEIVKRIDVMTLMMVAPSKGRLWRSTLVKRPTCLMRMRRS